MSSARISRDDLGVTRNGDLLNVQPSARDAERPAARFEDISRGKARSDHEDKPDGGAASDEGHDEPNGDDKSGRAGGGWRGTIRKHPWAIGIAALVLIAGIVGGVIYYLHARHFESTDDAFIDAHPIAISSEVTGNVVGVSVTDNQVVKAGDLLVRIDNRDFIAAMDQAQAAIEQAQGTIDNYSAQIEAQKAQVEIAKEQTEGEQASLNFSRDENKRYQELVRSGYGTVQRAQQAGSDLQSKNAGLAADKFSQVLAERQIKVLEAQRETSIGQLDAAKAQKATAAANMSRTELHATVDGRITNLTAAVGQIATSSQALMILVPLDVYVTANFKEGQLALVRVGQPVDIEIDAFGKTYPGHIDSFQSGSGTAFSLLPAENATGNYVKVVQRIPTKITFDKRPDLQLGPGMSVQPTVTVR